MNERLTCVKILIIAITFRHYFPETPLHFLLTFPLHLKLLGFCKKRTFCNVRFHFAKRGGFIYHKENPSFGLVDYLKNCARSAINIGTECQVG